MAITQLSEPLADANAVQAAVFWVGRVVAVLICFVAAEWLSLRYFANRWENPAWLKPVVIITLIATLGVTAIELLLETLIPQRAEYDDEELFEISPVLALAVEYITILTILLPINLVLWLLIDHRGEQPAKEISNDYVPDAPEFLSKTRGIDPGDVVALGAEEHYVRVYSDSHSELIHHRFSDAVAQMPSQLGMQVHRSWWVADRHIIGARRKTRRWELIVGEDLRVPVSDRFTRSARERGYFKTKAPVPR